MIKAFRLCIILISDFLFVFIRAFIIIRYFAQIYFFADKMTLFFFYLSYTHVDKLKKKIMISYKILGNVKPFEIGFSARN